MSSYVEEEERLTGEYKLAFEQVESYVSLNPLVEHEKQDELMMNLVDLLYTAQVERKPAAKIIGSDVKSFCENYFRDWSKPIGWLKVVAQIIYTLSWLVLASSVLDIVFEAGTNGVPLLSVRSDISPYVISFVCTVIAIAILTLLSKRLPFSRKFSAVKTERAVIIVTAIACVAVIISNVAFNTAFPLSIELPSVAAACTALAFAVIYKAVELAARHRKYGSIKKPGQEDSATFGSVYRSTYNAEMAKELDNMYARKNARLEKKGKPAMTIDEFADYKDRHTRRSNIWIAMGYLIIFAASTLIVFQDSSPTDTAIFAAILGVIFVVIYALFYRLNSDTLKAIKVWRERCHGDSDTDDSAAEE